MTKVTDQAENSILRLEVNCNSGLNEVGGKGRNANTQVKCAELRETGKKEKGKRKKEKRKSSL